MQLKKPEQQAGCALFVRSGRSLIPTEAGERLLAYGRQILTLDDEVAVNLGSSKTSWSMTRLRRRTMKFAMCARCSSHMCMTDRPFNVLCVTPIHLRLAAGSTPGLTGVLCHCIRDAACISALDG